MTPRRLSIPVLASVLALTVLLPSTALAGASDLLPDLDMAPIFDIQLRTTDSGRKHLRFGTTVYNVGDGPIEVRAKNASGNVMGRVVQAIRQTDGSWRKVVKSDAKVFYAGDGHDHWHIARFNRATLTALAGSPPPELRLRKIGFCLVDSVKMSNPPPGTPQFRAYGGCGVRGSTSVKMGISLGWGDIYSADTRFQSIEVTGLPAGQYRLCATANPKGTWAEKGNNSSNNSAWINVHIDVASNTVTPIGEPGETPC